MDGTRAYAARTSVGRKRARNEDRYAARADLGLVLLADGVAGRPHGGRAADLALAAVEEHVARATEHGGFGVDAARAVLRAAFDAAHAAVLEAARLDESLARMTTTLVAGLFTDAHFVVASVGHSRVYRLRHGFLKQVTSDHVASREGVEALAEDDRSALRPLLQLLTRAVGGERTMEPDVLVERLTSGDIFLFCSNGLSDVVSPERIVQVILASGTLAEACEGLVATAQAQGADDDVTAILVDPSARTSRGVVA